MQLGTLFIILGYFIIGAGLIIGNLMVAHGGRLNSQCSEKRIIEQTKRSATVILETMSNNFDKIANLEKWKPYKYYFTQAKVIYDAAMVYMNQGKNNEAAEAFLLFRDIAVKVEDFDAAAGSSIIVAWRYADLKNLLKSAELKAEAGDFYIKANRIEEAVVWKNEAAKIYSNLGLHLKAQELLEQIKNLRTKS